MFEDRGILAWFWKGFLAWFWMGFLACLLIHFGKMGPIFFNLLCEVTQGSF